MVGAPAAPRQFGRVNWLGLATLYRREVKRFLVEWPETLGGVAVSGLLFLAVFHLALEAAPQPLPGVSLVAFLIPGLIAVSIAQKSFEAAAFSILFDKLEGVIVDVLTPPLTAGERTIAYTLAGASSGLVSGAAAALVLLPFAPWPEIRLLPLVFFLAVVAVLHALFGILAALKADRWDNLAAIQTFGLAPLIYLSGAFFPTRDLPQTGRVAVLLNPTHYAVDGLRLGWLGQSELAPAGGAILLISLNLALFALVWRLFAAGYKLRA
ncbi:MAG TPA: ABC transporter permease [Alphaproteobacteria bacterium]|nr:ABC transporter permease [Alphaproteobacteria bacterium]